MVISGTRTRRGQAFILDTTNGNRIRNVSILLRYIERIISEFGISEYKFCKDNSLACSYVTNLRRVVRNDPNAFHSKLSFDLLVNLSLRYGVPFLASDYLDTSANYPNNYLHKKTESKPNKLAKKPTKAPPKPKFI